MPGSVLLEFASLCSGLLFCGFFFFLKTLHCCNNGPMAAVLFSSSIQNLPSCCFLLVQEIGRAHV